MYKLSVYSVYCILLISFVPRTEAQRYYDIRAEAGLHHRRIMPHLARTNQPSPGTWTNQAITILEMGMNYYDDAGQLVPSEELVELSPDGAVALRTPIKVKFSPDINVSGAIDITTPEGKWLRATPLGLSYFDAASGQSVMLAETQASEGEIHGENRVIYQDFLDDIAADLVYEVRKSGVMQMVILKERLQPPSAYGLADGTSRLEVITEFINVDQPQKKLRKIKGEIEPAKRSAMVQPDFFDEVLTFNEVSMPAGLAFGINEDGPEKDPVKRAPVGKTWQELPAEGRSILFEAVEYAPIKPQLDALPPRERPTAMRGTSRSRIIPSKRLAIAPRKSLQLAAAGYRLRGFAVDYSVVTTMSSLTFASGSTYVVHGPVTISHAYFQPGSVVKFDSGGSLRINHDVNMHTDTQNPTVFTAYDDDSYGQIIPEHAVGSTTYSASDGQPNSFNGPAVHLDNLVTSGMVRSAKFRNAATAIRWTSAGTYYHNVENSRFENCTTGVHIDGYLVSLFNLRMCNVSTYYTGTPYAANGIVNDCTGGYTEVPKGGMTASASSYFPASHPWSLGYNWEASKAIDGNLGNPCWHSGPEYYPATGQFLRLDVGTARTIGRVDYYPRSGLDNGSFHDYKIYVTDVYSSVSAQWGPPVAEGTFNWTYGIQTKTLEFQPKSGRYVIFECMRGVEDWAAAGEVWVYETGQPSGQPLPTPIFSVGFNADHSTATASATSQSGSTVYYTYSAVPGTPPDPTQSSQTTPPSFSVPTTVKAKAFQSGYTASAVTTVTVGQTANVSFSPSGHSGSQYATAPLSVTMSAESGASVFYQVGAGPSPTTSGLVGYWPMDEGTGSTTADLSGSGYNGSLMSGASWAGGAGGSAASFDGVDDYVYVGPQPALTMSSALTMTAWIYPVGTHSGLGGIVVNKEDQYEFALMEGRVQWAFYNTNPGWAWIDTGYTPALNQWTHVAITYENGLVKTYINGTLIHSYSGSGNIQNSSLTRDLRIGGRQWSSQPFNGRIDQVRVYNRALTASEVTVVAGGSASWSSISSGSSITIDGIDNGSGAVQAYAYTSTKLKSQTTSVTYNFKAQAPQFTASFNSDHSNATITGTSGAATVYYTTNGSEPTQTSSTTPPTVTGCGTTIKAKAFKTGYTPSDTATWLCPGTTAVVVFSPNGHNPIEYSNGPLPLVMSAESGATVYYKRTTGSTWSSIASGGTVNVDGINAGNGMIEAYAFTANKFRCITTVSGEYSFRVPQPTHTISYSGSTATLTFNTLPNAALDIYFDASSTVSETLTASGSGVATRAFSTPIKVRGKARKTGYIDSGLTVARVNKLWTPKIATPNGVLSGNVTVNGPTDVWLLPNFGYENIYGENGNVSPGTGAISFTSDVPNSNFRGAFFASSSTTYAPIEYITTSYGRTYSMAGWFKSVSGSSRVYSGVINYDTTGQFISADDIYNGYGLTYLTQPLANGSTTAYLSDEQIFSPVSEWWYFNLFVPISNFSRTAPFSGENQPNFVRDLYQQTPLNEAISLRVTAVNAGSKSVILNGPYSGPTLPIGTPIARRAAGGSYQYSLLSYAPIPPSWAKYNATFSYMRDGTDSVRVHSLLSYVEGQSVATGLEFWEGTQADRPNLYYSINGGAELQADGPIKVQIASSATISIRQKGTYYFDSDVVSRTLTFKAAAPQISSTINSAGSQVTHVVTTATADAEIRYSTDGTEPIAGSPLYTAGATGMVFPATMTTKWKAFKSNYIASDTITKLGVTTFSPPSGSYGPGQSVTITAAPPGTQLRMHQLRPNILNPSTWVLGSSGSQTGFSTIGSSEENSIQIRKIPYGSVDKVWVASNLDTDPCCGASDPDGGWNTDLFSVDPTKTYRFSVWIRKVDTSAESTSGYSYLGCGPYVSTLTGTSSDSQDPNPYFWAGMLPLNEWHMFVGYIHPAGHLGTTQGSRLFNAQGQAVSNGTDFRWLPGAAASYHRSYLFYCTEAGIQQEFWNPRVEVVNSVNDPIDVLINPPESSSRTIALNPGTHTLQALSYSSASGVLSSDVSTSVYQIAMTDTDGDGLSDSWETQYFGNLNENGTGDWDGDGLTNLQEYQSGGDPTRFVGLRVYTPWQ